MVLLIAAKLNLFIKFAVFPVAGWQRTDQQIKTFWPCAGHQSRSWCI